MIVIIKSADDGDNEESALNMVALNIQGIVKKNYGKSEEIVRLTGEAAKPLETFKSGETLTIVAHGTSDSKRVGGLRPEALLEKLEAYGLNLRHQIIFVNFAACYAGQRSKEVREDSYTDVFSAVINRARASFGPQESRILQPVEVYGPKGKLVYQHGDPFQLYVEPDRVEIAATGSAETSCVFYNLAKKQGLVPYSTSHQRCIGRHAALYP